VKLGGTPLRAEFLEKKLQLVLEAMEEREIDMWLTFTREGNEDPLAEDLRLGDLTWRSAGIIEKDGTRTAIVGSLEVELVKQRKLYHQVMGYGSEGAAPKLREFLRRSKPKKIAVNTSQDEGAADGLSSGMQRYLAAALRQHPHKLVSAEDLAIALRARLIPEEVRLLRESVAHCEKIYGEVEDVIRPGKTDKQVHEFARRLVAERGLTTAWAEDHCPSVQVGSSPAGHLGYYGEAIEEGDFVKLDFGVKYEGYCSDIQRNYFVGRAAVPAGVRRMFETAKAANDAALSILRPGVQGYKVDAIARNLIVKRGYPEYMHALGHVLGRSTHEIGPLLGPRWRNRYGAQGEKRVQKDMVFTIEPSVDSEFGTCNLEQDVLTIAEGYRDISKRQEHLIRVG
jgi:Xaa-Pro aminopeptidase